jgi:23S rRNA pseudouridine2605 synthase
MRINKYVALSTGISRRAADKAITWGRVKVNDTDVVTGQDIGSEDVVTFDGKQISPAETFTTIIFNKPAGYVVSRDGQGAKSIYELLPESMHQLKPVGRLDKASSGLLLLTNDGELANQLTHPSYNKEKVYEIELYISLSPDAKQKIERGIMLDDGVSKLKLHGHDTEWTVTMHEGRNRQIRRTFGELGFTVAKLHRTTFGPYKLTTNIGPGKYKKVEEASS